jgi:hypothetical protein
VNLTTGYFCPIVYRQLHKDVNIARGLLLPLKHGRPVVLAVEDAQAFKKKRVKTPKLFLTPLTMYGELSSRICIAFEAHGCEIVETRQRISPVVFLRIGISAQLARALATELTLIFTGGK